MEIYVADWNGRNMRRLTVNKAVDISPAWNPKTGNQSRSSPIAMERRSFTSWMRKGRMFSVLLRTRFGLEPSVVAGWPAHRLPMQKSRTSTSISTCTISQPENMCN